METNDTEHCRNLIVIDRQKIFLYFEQSRAAPLINVLFRRLRFSGGTAHVQRTERGKFSRGHIPAGTGRIGDTASLSWLLNSLSKPGVVRACGAVSALRSTRFQRGDPFEIAAIQPRLKKQGEGAADNQRPKPSPT